MILQTLNIATKTICNKWCQIIIQNATYIHFHQRIQVPNLEVLYLIRFIRLFRGVKDSLTILGTCVLVGEKSGAWNRKCKAKPGPPMMVLQRFVETAYK